MNDVKACSQRKAGNSNHVFSSLGIQFLFINYKEKKGLCTLKAPNTCPFRPPLQLAQSDTMDSERREADLDEKENQDHGEWLKSPKYTEKT